MSEHLRSLIDLFSLSKLNFDTANRKTLDSWVKKVQLQRRRQLLFESSCERGKKKSRVALCKKKGRPGFSIELSTLSTKKLRDIIKTFLAELGLQNYGSLEKKTDKELQKISENKGWERLLFMSDVNTLEDVDDSKNEKEGGMLSQGIPRQGRRFRHSFLDQGAKPVQQAEIFPAGRHQRGSPAKKKKPKKKEKPEGAVKKKRSTLLKKPVKRAEETEQFDIIPEQEAPRRRIVITEDALVPYLSDSPDEEPRRGRSRSRSRSRSAAPKIIPPQHATPIGTAEHRAMYTPDVRAPPRLGTPILGEANEPLQDMSLDSMQQAGADVANLSVPDPSPFFATAPPIPPPVHEKKDVKEVPEKKIKEHHPKMAKVPAVLPSNMERHCYREKEFSDECSDCSPTDLARIKLPRLARKELRYLQVQRKLVCERTALLKCKFDELRYQRMCWDLFAENASGDFFARIAKDKFKTFEKCTPNTAYDTSEISRMRGILACYSDSQRVCKGYHQVKAKQHNDSSKLGPNYTLPTKRYDQLEKEQKTETRDRFLETALRNRQPEDETGYKNVCEKDAIVPPSIPTLDKKPEGQMNSLTAPGVLVQKPTVLGAQPETEQKASGDAGQPLRIPPMAEPHPTGEPSVPVLPRPSGPFFGGGNVGGSPRKIVPGVPGLSAFQSEMSDLPHSHTIAGEQALEMDWLEAAKIQVTVKAMRKQGKTDEEIVAYLNKLGRNTTVEQLAKDFPPDITIQDPSAFHFQMTPSGRFANSPKALKSVVSIPLPEEHGHVHPNESPAQNLIRSTQTPSVQQLPSESKPVWTVASMPSGSLATEIPQPPPSSIVPTHKTWEDEIASFQKEYNIPQSPGKHVQFFGTSAPSASQVKAGTGFQPKKEKKEPKRKSLVGELFKRQKKTKRSKSSTPKKKRKKSKTPKKKRSKSITPKKIPQRLPKDGSGWDDDDYLAGMVSQSQPVVRLTRQPSIRRKRHFR